MQLDEQHEGARATAPTVALLRLGTSRVCEGLPCQRARAALKGLFLDPWWRSREGEVCGGEGGEEEGEGRRDARRLFARSGRLNWSERS